ncbi:helix-turn-helix domain-containing protein [Chryseobacterium sp. PS-8]|uniref:Helix-turn-helix domain-containing protein n=1 Tax=Chryseobacterium indicum TaxID=2766954 RepID=A0ABS9CBE8_9FLAO|nr:helix-turn-helix domain-containing protein [Chryseobacterium sp. PS-8]MCF2221499.1 helix-turn-helix domain-containing protein [Chryseobacterium sp. PS-8]
MKNAAQINYKKIYQDILEMKFPEKKEQCFSVLNKKELSMLDVIDLNQKIFGKSDKQTDVFNQRHRSYDKSAVLKILEYQTVNNLNNSELAKHFKLSRNTITKWRRNYSEIKAL